VVVDCDDEEGLAAFEALGQPDTLTVVSSSTAKKHFYYQLPPGAEFAVFEFVGGNVTAKAEGYVVCPPALHPSGVQYRLENGKGVAECDYEALVKAAGAARKRTHDALLSDPDAKVTRGNRHPQLVSLAGTCRHRGFDFETALDVVQRFNTRRCEPPYSEAAVEEKVRDVYERYEPGPTLEHVEGVDAGEWDDDLGALLDAVQKTLTRFLVVGAPESHALALWVAHTHVFAAAEVTPYIEIRSPEKRCGTSTLLRVLASMVARPRMSADMSDAVLYRLVQQERPTLLWDEVDGLFGSKTRDREDTRKLLNAGFEAGATTWRMGGENKTTFEEFAIFCPKAFASIGKLPDTLTDRSITIHMLRKHRGEKVERARRRVVREAGKPLHDQLAAWAGVAVGDP
jgi:Bifunctional DNA primase/polymerase, N-terminal